MIRWASILSLVFCASTTLASVCHRTNEVVKILELKTNIDCGEIIAADLVEITELDFYAAGLYPTSLQNGDFDDLPNLQKINFYGCKLPVEEKLRLQKALPHVDIRF